MNEYTFITNPIEIISGTSNTTAPAYIEAANNIKSSPNKALGYMKNFVTSIENIAVTDPRISGSAGNIEKFGGYHSINYALNFLSKSLHDADNVKDLRFLLTALQKYKTEYSDGYKRQVRLIMLEYETALYMLVTGLSFTIANHIDVHQVGIGVKVSPKPGKSIGIITRTIKDMARELYSSDHRKYLAELVRLKEQKPLRESINYNEGAVGDTLELLGHIYSAGKNVINFGFSTIKTIKKTAFGIIPLIRSAMYLWYKKKADTILKLDEQVKFIEMNIEQLQNIQNMDETKKAEIIKKQQAVIEAFRKKSEKLRAELVESEKSAADALNEENSKIKDTDDDFILD
jgi:lipoate-protein ligase A